MTKKIKSSEITNEVDFMNRRKIILSAGLLGLASKTNSIPLIKNEIDDIKSKITGEKFVTSYNNFYEFGTKKSDPKKYAKTLITEPWNIVVDGECEKSGSIGIEDILKLTQEEERIYRFRCVEAWGMVVPWNGFSLNQLLKQFKPTSKAKYVAFETLADEDMMPGISQYYLDWPYREGLRIDEAMHPLTMLTYGAYGKKLKNQNGAPLRLIVPWKYGFKSIKSIIRITFTEKEPFCSWKDQAPHEYGFYANVNPEVDHPRWSQKNHKMLGTGIWAKKEKTELFNGYQDEVAHLYKNLNLKRNY